MEGRFASKCRLGPPLVPGGLPSLEIGAKLVRDIRDVRQGKYSTRKNEAVEARSEDFHEEKVIWDARDAMVIDEADAMAIDQYIGAVVGLRFASMIAQKQVVLRAFNGQKRVVKVIGKEVTFQCRRLDLNTVLRWPRVRPHWRRFQRRLCHNCPACAHLGEPRYMVCSGCGVARYCSEQCQREHWPFHQKDCLACQEADAPR